MSSTEASSPKRRSATSRSQADSSDRGTTRDPAPTRDRERTRKALLESAAHMIFEHGAGVSLAEIAAHAGVSKGALTHHFASRQQLEEAVLTDSAGRFKEAVYAHVDFSENAPGKLLRAYVRALTSDTVLMREHFSPTSLVVVLANNPMAEQMLAEDAAEWRAAFDADGIDLGISVAVRSAAEGLAASYDTPYLSEEELQSATVRLLELSWPTA